MKNLSERFQGLIEDPSSTVPYYSVSEFSMHQLLDFLKRIAVCHQFFGAGSIDAVKTAVAHLRAANAQMDLTGSGLLDKFHYLADCGSAYDAVVYQYYLFTLEEMGQYIELLAYAFITNGLFRFDEGTADIVVTDKPQR